jgi:hypothetical protein
MATSSRAAALRIADVAETDMAVVRCRTIALIPGFVIEILSNSNCGATVTPTKEDSRFAVAKRRGSVPVPSWLEMLWTVLDTLT